MVDVTDCYKFFEWERDRSPLLRSIARYRFGSTKRDRAFKGIVKCQPNSIEVLTEDRRESERDKTKASSFATSRY